ncbi:MobF family relaxase [Pseudokineococcus marinus]|uniref:Relaxase domain-containing protein n=1 Tax=Pseudokineococcus marinus TaxID=351215 RepID=A0A849BM53_9ACTN|nr:MobF family relaxase [Pseudokineococcus marinus]NNH21714.1 relaxase domain-containing protein [Pseudokineococcus marinus]
MTTIGAAPEQVEYRLAGSHGCLGAQASTAQVDYHVDGRERPLVWTGAGLAEVGIEAGTVLDEAQFNTARALMAGVDPRSGERLVEPKLAVHEDAKVALAPLVRAVAQQAAEEGVEPAELFTSAKVSASWQRALRAVASDGDGAMLRADEAGVLADRAGVDVEKVWGADAYATAVGNLVEVRSTTGEDGTTSEQVVPRRKVVGNLGYDVSFTLPKSHSLLLAFADERAAASVEQVYTAKVGDTFDWLEAQTAYGMRGKHGGGKSAATIPGSGFLGWSMVHRAARPVGDAVTGDPHWHVHVTIANMTKGEDGRWSTVAAGGRDLMRHAPAADHVLKALVRRELSDEFGVTFARSTRTGAWEVEAIPDETLRTFSKRGASIEAMLRDLGFDPEVATRRAEDLAAAQTRHEKGHATASSDEELRQAWQDEARASGLDPAAVAAAAMPGPRPVDAQGQEGDSPEAAAQHRQEQEAQRSAELLADVVRSLQDPEDGLTSTRRRFTRVDALAAVADALPSGAADVAEVERLTDAALTDAGFVSLAVADVDGLRVPAAARRQLGADHMANARRFTTRDVVAAERVVLEAAQASAPGQGAAHVAPTTAVLARSTVEATQGFELSSEQARMVERLVTDDRALDTVLGPPGTGKTTLMRAARTAWEAEGLVVAGAATAAVAAQNLSTESGIASRTVAQWVHRIRTGSGLAGVDVLVLDEANLTDDRDRATLYRAAQTSGTKVVEVGDPQQLRGVGCGSLFGRVHDIVGGGELTANRRQRDEDERAAIAAWRDGRYRDALGSWSDRGRLVATETGDQALVAMVSRWMDERAGAPDAHAEMRGVVMLASSNEAVGRLNEAAQAVREAAGELGPQRTYDVRGGRTLTLHEGDHVLIRLNDRAQRMHEGPDVLNGYRGVVEGIETDGRLRVAWRCEDVDGHREQTATLTPGYVAAGGVSLGYAMTGHKAEGLTVEADWTRPDGVHQGGSVLVHGPGMDEPGMHVATSRHRDRVHIFAGRQQLETAAQTHDRGIPTTDDQRQARVVTALAEHARTHDSSANDKPVLDKLEPGRYARPATAERPAEAVDPDLTPRAGDPAPERPTQEGPARPEPLRHEPVQEEPVSEHTFTTEDQGAPAQRWTVGWDPAAASHYANVAATTGADTASRPVAGPAAGEGRSLSVEDLQERLSRQSVQLPPQVREDLIRAEQTRALDGARPTEQGPRVDVAAAAPPPARTTSTPGRPATTTTSTQERPRGLDRFLSAEQRELDRRSAARAEAPDKTPQTSTGGRKGSILAAVQQAADEADRRAAQGERRAAEQEDRRRQEAARQAERAKRAKRDERNSRDRGPRL